MADTPQNDWWGWVITMAGFFGCYASIGTLKCSAAILRVLLAQFSEVGETPPPLSAMVMPMFGHLNAIMALIAPILMQHVRPSYIAAIATLICTVCTYSVIYIKSLVMLFILFGIVTGLFVMVPFQLCMMSLPQFIKDAKLSLASGIIFCGASVATLTTIPLITWISDLYGEIQIFAILAGIQLNGLLCAAALWPVRPKESALRKTLWTTLAMNLSTLTYIPVILVYLSTACYAFSYIVFIQCVGLHLMSVYLFRDVDVYTYFIPIIGVTEIICRFLLGGVLAQVARCWRRAPPCLFWICFSVAFSIVQLAHITMEDDEDGETPFALYVSLAVIFGIYSSSFATSSLPMLVHLLGPARGPMSFGLLSVAYALGGLSFSGIVYFIDITSPGGYRKLIIMNSSIVFLIPILLITALVLHNRLNASEERPSHSNEVAALDTCSEYDNVSKREDEAEEV